MSNAPAAAPVNPDDSSPSADSISSFGLPLSSPESLKSEVRKSDEGEKESFKNQNDEQQQQQKSKKLQSSQSTAYGQTSGDTSVKIQSPSRGNPAAGGPVSSAGPAAGAADNEFADSELISLMEKVDVNLKEVSESRQGRRKPYKDNKQTAKDRLMLPHLSPIEITAELEGLIPDSAKNVYLFVNPSSGGNAAASFMEAGMERIRLTVQQPVNLWIWDIRQGKSGEKPGFVKLKQTVEGLKHQMRSEQRTGGQSPNEGDPSTPSLASSSPISPFAFPVPPSGKARMGSEETSNDSHNGDDDDDGNKQMDNNLVYVIVAGGDGTVMWCIMELWAHKIDDEFIVIGVVPYGTGNDFARALGWNKFNAAKPYEHNFKTLKTLIKEWLNAQIIYHDIWNVDLIVKMEGSFQKIDSKTRKKKNVEGIYPSTKSRILSKTFSSFLRSNLKETSSSSAAAQESPSNLNAANLNFEGKVLRLKMSNYFSCGVESRIGVGFDRYRTRNQILNKIRYAIEGVKKASCRPTQPINMVVEKFVEGVGNEKIVFSTAGESQPIKLRYSTMSIVASNIPSFAAGLDLWQPSTNVALERKSGASNADEDVQLKKHVQKLGDGILEFVSYNSVFAMGVERVIHGQGNRVFMGRGPFEMKFKSGETVDSKTSKTPNKVYCQVDGEFYILNVPDSIRICFKRRIKVLASDSFDAKNAILVDSNKNSSC